MKNKQKTIKKEFVLSGAGLHTGNKIILVIKPADINTGINFLRSDLEQRPLIKADFTHVSRGGGVYRSTSIGCGENMIHTVEHLMSVLCGLGITNLLIEIDGNELPGLDGSSQTFLTAFQESGIVEQEAEIDVFLVQKALGVEADGSSIFVFPAKDFSVSYTLDYDHPVMGSQFFSSKVNEELFKNNIAPARTFCLESEVLHLQSQGLGQGANYKNTLVVGKDGVKENSMRFTDEFARHKVLDLIGDLYLLGVPLQGHVVAVKSGHDLNLKLLKKLADQKEFYDQRGVIPGYDVGEVKELDVGEIMKILPHRYPFLLVDRIFEIEKGKRAIGLKNVTINDGFFSGHFPTRPTMPGVLMVEAMAQVSGIVMMTNPQHHGKIAFFSGIDKARFRKVVSPGDQLVMEVEVKRDRSRVAQVAGVAKVNGEIVAETNMMFSYADASFLG